MAARVERSFDVELHNSLQNSANAWKWSEESERTDLVHPVVGVPSRIERVPIVESVRQREACVLRLPHSLSNDIDLLKVIPVGSLFAVDARAVDVALQQDADKNNGRVYSLVNLPGVN